MRWKNFWAQMVALVITIAIVLAIVLSVAVLGGAVLAVFGLEYQSVGAVVFFVVAAGIVGFPLETLAQALPSALLSLGRLSLWGARILFVVLDTAATMAALKVVDYFLDSVSAGNMAVFAMALIFALTSIGDIQQEEAPHDLEK